MDGSLPGSPAAALSPTLSLLEVGLQLAQTASPRRTSDSRGVAHGLRRALHALRLGQNRRFWLDVSNISTIPRSVSGLVRKVDSDSVASECARDRVRVERTSGFVKTILGVS